MEIWRYDDVIVIVVVVAQHHLANLISAKTETEMIRLKTLDLEESDICKREIYLQPLILLRPAHIVQ